MNEWILFGVAAATLLMLVSLVGESIFYVRGLLMVRGTRGRYIAMSVSYGFWLATNTCLGVKFVFHALDGSGVGAGVTVLVLAFRLTVGFSTWDDDGHWFTGRRKKLLNRARTLVRTKSPKFA